MIKQVNHILIHIFNFLLLKISVPNHNVIDINHDSLGETLKPQPKLNNNQHLENRHEEEKKIMKSPRVPNEYKNIESPFKPFRQNSFDTQSKMNGEGKNYRIMLNIRNSINYFKIPKKYLKKFK